MERDAAFAQKKAERACLRVHLREKYRLPKVRRSSPPCLAQWLRVEQAALQHRAWKQLLLCQWDAAAGWDPKGPR